MNDILPTWRINSSELCILNQFLDLAPGLRLDPVYSQAQDPQNIFKTAIYRPNPPVILHYRLAFVVLKAAAFCQNNGLYLVIKDGLRSCEAQQAMLETEIVKQNPNWLEEPRLLSPPGKGAHPRGMAVDLVIANPDSSTPKGWKEWDFGTEFDYLSPYGADKARNPAHRAYRDLSDAVLENRTYLDSIMLTAAQSLDVPLLPLPQEWWDYRLPADIFAHYHPLWDKDLPAPYKMT